MSKQKKRMGIEQDGPQRMFLIGTERSVTARSIPLFVHENIESPTDVVAHVDTLRQLEEGDWVDMYVSGQGGCVSSVDLLLHEMQKAMERGVSIHCICTGLVASAFSFIPLYSTSFELSEGFHALLHCGSAGVGGTLAEFKASSSFTTRYMETRLRDVYQGFLTDKEIQDMLEGKDMWLDSEEWIERFNKRNELLQQQLEQEENEENGAEYTASYRPAFPKQD